MTLAFPKNPFLEEIASENGGLHVLYIYTEENLYFQNAMRYIQDGLTQNYVVLMIDSDDHIKQFQKNLSYSGLSEEQLERLIFLDHLTTYLSNGEFDVKRAEQAHSYVAPFIREGHSIRAWGNIPLPDIETTLEKLKIHEANFDSNYINESMLSVCAYNGVVIPAFVQNELLKTHSHFMTDHDFQVSLSYKHDHIHYPTADEKNRLRDLESQNHTLKQKNDLLYKENQLVKFKNEVIRESEKQVRTIIDQLPLPILIRHGSNLVFLNEMAYEKFGLRMGELTNDHLLFHFFKKYDQLSGTSLAAPFGDVPANYFKTPTNQHYLVKSMPLLFEGVDVLLHAFVDISHEKENERLLIRSEKMNIVGELAASIAHELRNPLTAVKGFFQLLKTTNGKDIYYKVIEDELSRVEQISTELLTLAKPHSNQRKQFNMIQLIQEVIVLLRAQANSKNVELLLETSIQTVEFYCEGNKIKQVFINLIKNAIDAMNDSGLIVVKATKQAGAFQVKIIDQGSGIPKEIIDKIGEPFYTTKEKGTGIGLLVCYRIIESHNGSIQVESEENVGTTFTITLPLVIN